LKVSCGGWAGIEVTISAPDFLVMTIKKVALIGANGRLGPAILHGLLSASAFTVTVLSRSSSTSTYPDSVHVTYISDDPPDKELIEALRGQDAIVVTFPGSNSDLQIRLADAAAQVGVRRFIPADFGSCDSSSPRALDLMPLYRAKQKVQQHLRQLASSSSLSWTSLVCGHFFDYGLKSGLLQFDVKARKGRIFDGGNIKWSATTIGTIAMAVVQVLQKEDETRNNMLYIQSFCITQNELLRSLEQVTGQDWQVEHVDSEEYIKEAKKEVDRDPHNAEAIENLVSVVGIVDANWEGKDDFANALLDLKDDDLDLVIKEVIEN
jgi:putative NADH-flavin reductase